ncbi:MAG: hypothetical protein WCH99_00265 [Verrucomicrobiota bacterium]
MISIFQALLAQLEATVATFPQLVEDGRSDSLGNEIQNYQTKIARIKNALRKHQDHERRRREIEKQNRDNSRKH